MRGLNIMIILGISEKFYFKTVDSYLLLLLTDYGFFPYH